MPLALKALGGTGRGRGAEVAGPAAGRRRVWGGATMSASTGTTAAATGAPSSDAAAATAMFDATGEDT